MWFMAWIAADCAIVALVFVYSSIISYRDGWQSIDYIAVLLPLFASSILFSSVIWPRGWIPGSMSPFLLGTTNTICFAGIGAILAFTNAPVAWGVSLGLAGLFRPYNTAFIAYFGFNDKNVDVFAALCRLRTLFEHIGFIIAAFVAFHAFHYFEDGNATTTIGLFAILIATVVITYRAADDPRFGFYRALPERVQLASDNVHTALRSVLIQLFIVEAIRYSLVSYGFIVLLTRVQYVSALLPATLGVNGIVYFFGSSAFMSNVLYSKHRAVGLAIVACLFSFIGQLIIDFSTEADSAYIFIPYTLASTGLSLISHLPLMRMYSVVTSAKIANASFASSELSVIHLGAATGCLLTLAIHKWFACPPYTLYIALLLYLQLSEQHIEDDIRGLSVLR